MMRERAIKLNLRKILHCTKKTQDKTKKGQWRLLICLVVVLVVQ